MQQGINAEVGLDDPFDCRSNPIKDVRAGSETKRKYLLIIKLVLPVDAQKMIVFRADWDQPEGISYVQLRQQSSTTVVEDVADSIVYANVPQLKSSREMPSLTLVPGGADRWWITRNLPFFFGTTPRPEQRILGKGWDWKGPAVCPSEQHVFKHSVIC